MFLTVNRLHGLEQYWCSLDLLTIVYYDIIMVIIITIMYPLSLSLMLFTHGNIRPVIVNLSLFLIIYHYIPLYPFYIESID
jgi:hypothetical protein